jgi:hypothetical protein
MAMPLSLQMLLASVRINSFSELIGTGFVVTVVSETVPENRWGYVVTANHVVDKYKGMDRNVVAYDPTREGAPHTPIPVENWRQPLPNVDLAIAPFSIAGVPMYALKLEDHVVPTDLIPGPNLGAHVYYVGVFTLVDRVMARSGTLGAINVEGVPGHGAPVHLLDCRSYDGFSGSPCFFEIAYGTDRQQDIPYPGPDPQLPFTAMAYFQLLCGVFVSHFSDEQSAGGLHSRYGVGIIVRSEEIIAALTTPDAIAERSVWDGRAEQAQARG